MFFARNFLVFSLLILGFNLQANAQKQDSTIVKPKVYSGKTGFIKQKAGFLKLKSDSAFVYVFDGQSNYTLKEFYDTITLEFGKVAYETANCVLFIDENQLGITLKSNEKKIKFKPAERAELNTFLNESLINEQRELFFNLSKQNLKSYAVYDKIVKDSGVLALLAKDYSLFLKAFNAAFKDVKPLEEEDEEDF